MIENMTYYKEKIEKLVNANVLVIGDIILDKFIYGDVLRISPEAPVPVLHVNHEENYIGGAGNVARNIATILDKKNIKTNGKINLIGIVGDDDSSLLIKDEMNNYSIDNSSIIIDKTHPTITKTRIVASTQQIVRMDEEDLTPFNNDIEVKIKNEINKYIDDCNVVIISDYGKGVITKDMAEYIIKLSISKNKKVLVDPVVKHFNYYQNATLMTPNLKEAIEGVDFNMQSNEYKIDKINELGNLIKSKLSLENLMITLSAHGMALFSDDIKIEDSKPYIISTKAKTVFDVSGAGDTVIAIVAMCLSTGCSFVEAAHIANIAAGVVVGKRGTSTLTLKEIENEL